MTEQEDALSFDGLDVRPTPVDQLVNNPELTIQQRIDKLQSWKEKGTTIVETRKSQYEESQEVYEFIIRELEGAELALLLKRGVKVRVVCPDCRGTGMRPEDVTSGQYQKAGHAFSTGTATARTERTPVIPDTKKCLMCKGKRWMIMERFKG
jgi:hypothetical protein